MGGSGGGGTQTSKTTTALPKWLRPYAQGLTKQAQGLYGSGGPYPQQQVAPFNPYQQAGFNQIAGQSGYGNQPAGGPSMGQPTGGGQPPTALSGAMQQGQSAPGSQQGGGPVGQGLSGAQNQLNNIIGGQFLNPQSNQYLQDYYNQAAQGEIANYTQAVAPNILANAVGAGGLGSSGTEQAFQNAQGELGSSLQNLAASIYEPAYQAGLGQMTSALGMEPGMAQAQYIPGQELLGIGGQQQQQLQNILNTGYTNQMMPYTMLGQGAGLIGPLSGNAGSQVTVGPNPNQSAK